MLTNDYEELKDRAERYRKFIRFTSFFIDIPIGFLLAILIPVVIASYLSFSNWSIFVSMLGGSAIWFVIVFALGNKFKKYRVSDNEWVSYYSCEIFNLLEKATKAKNVELKKDYYKKSVKFAREFRQYIDAKWTIGKLQMVRAQYGKPIELFKKNLSNVIIPTLISQKEPQLEQVKQIMYNITLEAQHFDLKGLTSINEQIASKFPLESRQSKVETKLSYEKMISSHPVVASFIFVAGVIIGCSLFYYFATDFSRNS